MTNVFYMCFGIFIFVLGQIFQEVYGHYKSADKRPKRKAPIVEACQEEEESFIEVPDEFETMPDLNEDSAQSLTYEHAIQTYPNVQKTPATPPRTNAEGLYDYVPSLHEDVDVEIITPEREIEIFKKANRLGGL